MKYIVRSIKYFVYISILLALVMALLVAFSLVGSDVESMFRGGYKSLWQIALLFAAVAAIYPKFGFICKQAAATGEFSEIKDGIVRFMEGRGYRLESEKADGMTFRMRSRVNAFFNMMEDRITITESFGGVEVEGITKEVVRLVGIDALSRDERMVMETAKSLREDFLHQNAFHEIDTYASMDKQFKMLKTIIAFHHAGLDALHKGAPMNKLFNLPVREQIARMRYLEEKDIAQIDKLDDTIKEQINGIIPVGGDTNAA